MESQLHLLLLEDDQQLRTALESLLVDEGYEVATAADGREAVAQAAKQAPDILLLAGIACVQQRGRGHKIAAEDH